MEIGFDPYKKLSFRSYIQYDTPEIFAKTLTVAVPQGVPVQTTMYWSDGVLFRVVNLPSTDTVVKEYVAGHLPLDHLEFAYMPKYAKQIQLPDNPMVMISVIDVSNHTLFGPLGKWIRENLIKKLEP